MGNRAFKSSHNHFLSAENGTVKTHHGRHDHHTHFHIENHGHHKVALRTHCGKYVSIGDNKEVYLSHHFHGEHSLFHLEHHHGKVSIKGHHHHYIAADHHGHIYTAHSHHSDSLFEEFIV
ncbi:hypothetical protein RB653_005338 [Dictyostelium firmibasis]|uniref:Fascin-like domain-containing protein n=1 Tax=Dictyostelium firmibasis TaxID=79012 RepID=A0AAN7UCF1_9MYCE